jgi:hypothetical protein
MNSQPSASFSSFFSMSKDKNKNQIERMKMKTFSLSKHGKVTETVDASSVLLLLSLFFRSDKNVTSLFKESTICDRYAR